MTRTRAADILIKVGEFGISKCNDKCDNPYQALVDGGMAEEKARFPFGSYYLATAATPLALLTPTQLDCAEWLVDEHQVTFRDAEVQQRRQIAILVKKGLANEEMWSWKPTPKLIEAVECWREAKEGNR